MIITKLALNNFRSHKETIVPMSRVTVFRGPNAVGKSSIEQAISYALTGSCDGLTASGVGAQNLIRKGAEQFTIRLRTNVGELRLDYSKDKGKQVKEQNGWKLEAQNQVLRCVTNARYFLSLDAAGQQALLARMVLPDAITPPREIVDACEAVKLPLNFNQPPFQLLEVGYKQAFDMRRDINRDLANWRPIEFHPAQGSVQELQAKLATRHNEMAELKAKKTARSNQGNLQSVLVERAKAHLEKLPARIAEAEQQIEKYQALVLPKAKVDALRRSKAKIEEARQLDANIAENEAEMQRLRNQIAAIENTLVSKDPKKDALCPTCKQTVTEQVLSALVEPIRAMYNTFDSLKQGAIDSRKALGNPEADAVALAKHEEAVKFLDVHRERLAEMQEEQKQAEKDVNVAIAPAEPTDELDAAIEELSVRIEKGTRALADAINAEDARVRHEANEAKKVQLEEKLKQLEFLVERFGKDGYRAELIAHYIGTFEQSINDTLNAFGYECTLKFDPYQLMVVRNGVELPLQSLSKSQQFRFAIAFQVALSIHSGIGLVVIDETDMLDAEGRKALMRTVIATPELEQIICLGTDERTTFPHVDGLSVFYLHTDVDGATICQPLSQDTAA